jgi:hypothetical protein
MQAADCKEDCSPKKASSPNNELKVDQRRRCRHNELTQRGDQVDHDCTERPQMRS